MNLPGDEAKSRICPRLLSRWGGASRGWNRLGSKPWLLWLQPRAVLHCSLLVGEVHGDVMGVKWP